MIPDLRRAAPFLTPCMALLLATPAGGTAAPDHPPAAGAVRASASIVAVASPVARSFQEPDTATLLGFDREGSARQRTLEARFDTLLHEADLERWQKRMSSAPNNVGSPKGHENALFVDSLFRAWGYRTRIEEYRVLFPTPTERVLELLGPDRYTAELREPPVPGDSTSRVFRNRLPPYNAYSADGDVTAPLVYVNQGIPRDYEELERLGIDVKGKIVIARYGGSWRGIKPKVAAEHGAVGCILYSDPADDGYHAGDTYPDGPFRPARGVQRGSVLDMPLYPGDPLTPGRPATADADRLPRDQAPTIMKIPVLPISYEDARPFLAALAGPVAPEEWRGALPLTYHVGPGPARVHLKLAFDWSLAPAYDVVAMLPGSTHPDQWVIRGNHRDGWVFGAEDPLSGQVSLLAEAQAIGELARSGWKPRRTIVFTSWDAEEPALLGSTEWGEDHAAELQRKAVLYVNSDGYTRGFVSAGGSQTLESFFNQVAGDVPDPETRGSVLARVLDRRAVQGGDDGSDSYSLSPLGSGSDYTTFLQHLGITTLNVGYGGEGRGGIYHSAYDSFDWFRRFGDPGWHYGVALARTAGRLVLRAADASVLPLTLRPFAGHVHEYADQIMAMTDSMRRTTERRNRLVARDAYRRAHDPTKEYVPPDSQAAVPYLDFSPLQNAVARLDESARRYDEAYAAATGGGTLPPESTRERLNSILQHLEQTMLRDDGLPRRPWFKHQIYAPGFYTGYGVKTLPGVREAVEQRSWNEATREIRLVSETLESVADSVDSARRALGGG